MEYPAVVLFPPKMSIIHSFMHLLYMYTITVLQMSIKNYTKNNSCFNDKRTTSIQLASYSKLYSSYSKLVITATVCVNFHVFAQETHNITS